MILIDFVENVSCCLSVCLYVHIGHSNFFLFIRFDLMMDLNTNNPILNTKKNLIIIECHIYVLFVLVKKWILILGKKRDNKFFLVACRKWLNSKNQLLIWMTNFILFHFRWYQKLSKVRDTQKYLIDFFFGAGEKKITKKFLILWFTVCHHLINWWKKTYSNAPIFWTSHHQHFFCFQKDYCPILMK